MRRQLLIFALTLGLGTPANIPEITTYAKVTKNGEEANKNEGGPLSWMMRAFSTPNKTRAEISEGRSSPDVSITVSPVYVPPRIPELHKGEAVDYPTTKSYSTLDEEMVARLDAQRGRKEAQDRFHPPASFEHVIAHANAAKSRLKPPSSSSSSSSSASSSSSSGPSGPPQDSGSGAPSAGGPGFSSPVFPGSYDYKPPSFINAKPISMDSYSKPDPFPKALSSFDSSSISYGPSPDSYSPPADYPNHDQDQNQQEFDPELTHEIHASDYGSKPVYTAPKAIEYAGHFDRPAFVDDPYIHDHDHDHDYHHDIIYDHLPDDHTTPPPEMMDQRLSKRPYSYYFIGKKLWYIPLYFSIYFIIYIAALILKSIARHKINFPSNWGSGTEHSRSYDKNDGPGWMDLTVKVLEGVENVRKSLGKKT